MARYGLYARMEYLKTWRKKKLISLLLVCLMACSSVPLIFGNYASAATGAANFLPDAYYDDPVQGGFDTQNEVQRSQAATQYITTLLSNRYGSSNCYTKTGTICTKSAYTTTLNALQSYDKAVVYSKGHRTVYNYHPGIIPSHTTLYPDYNSYLLDPQLRKIGNILRPSFSSKSSNFLGIS
jgi:hypothetical protein